MWEKGITVGGLSFKDPRLPRYKIKLEEGRGGVGDDSRMVSDLETTLLEDLNER